MSKYCYVYALRSLKENQFYAGLTRDLLYECSITADWLSQQRNASRLSLYIGKATLTTVTQLHGSHYLKSVWVRRYIKTGFS